MVPPIGVAASSPPRSRARFADPRRATTDWRTRCCDFIDFAPCGATSAARDRGQGLAEYALILALIAIIAIVALIFLGGQISKILSDVGHSI